MVEGWQECFYRQGISLQGAMCGSVRYRDAETTVSANYWSVSSELNRTTSAELARRMASDSVQAVRDQGAHNRRYQRISGTF
jgi:hypothetical protein